MHALLDAGLRALGDAEQLDAVAELIRHLEVERRDLGDALHIDGVGVDLGAEGEARQDGELVGGVEALDVEGRVGLRVAEALRVREALGEGQALGLHARQDVVAGAVEDPVEARDGVAGQRLAQGLDHRDAAGGRGLEGERHAARLGHAGEREPVPGEKRLVGRDHVLAGLEGRLDGGLGGPVAAADQLDDAIDLAGAGEIARVVEPAVAGDVDAAVAGAVARRDGGDAHGAAAARGERVLLPGEDAHHGSADRAEAGDADAQGFDHTLIQSIWAVAATDRSDLAALCIVFAGQARKRRSAQKPSQGAPQSRGAVAVEPAAVAEDDPLRRESQQARGGVSCCASL